MDNGAFVLAGYLLTALALGGYVVAMFRRAARARRRVETIAEGRSDGVDDGR